VEYVTISSVIPLWNAMGNLLTIAQHCSVRRQVLYLTGRKLHSEELHISYFSPDIITALKSRKMRWAGHIAAYKMRNIYVIVAEIEGKRPLVRIMLL
jgi:hypothetical protein